MYISSIKEHAMARNRLILKGLDLTHIGGYSDLIKNGLLGSEILPRTLFALTVMKLPDRRASLTVE